MRLDKYLSESNICSRKEAAKAVSAGAVSVNGRKAADRGMNVDPDADEIIFCGKRVTYEKFVYIMMNKQI